MAILLVEDETLIRLMLVAELEAHGHAVIEAASADEALSILRNDTSIALLFTDVEKPGTIDGLELARLVRPRGTSQPKGDHSLGSRQTR